MLFLYLDESGDLGFDFVNKKPSKFFTITILAVHGKETNRKLIFAVKKTLKRKLYRRRKTRTIRELKGTDTTLEVKQYFLRQLGDIHLSIFSLSLWKKRLYEQLAERGMKQRMYNYLARLILEQVPFKDAKTRVYLIVDRSKKKPEIADFNQYILHQLQGRLNPHVPLDIIHARSEEQLGIQAADLFSWGIFQKHERSKTEWYNCFRHFIRLDEQFL